ncbi:MAG: hypothetical protein VX564_04265 [Nitrospirota bacterium]|nr:hypothetical protein [Nitrospirota bacterium]
MQKGQLNLKSVAFCVLGASVLLGHGTSLWAAMTAGVFGGFTNHISEQIMKDKVDFIVSENCAAWHYKQLKQKRIPPDVEKISFRPIAKDPESNPCPSEYGEGINGARSAFAQSQSSLSLSLTFYQFALVGDRNDNGEYDATELRDVLESMGVSFSEHEQAFQYLAKLNGKFDAVRQTIEFSVLTDGLQALYTKGYRLTPADQDALNQVTGQRSS